RTAAGWTRICGRGFAPALGATLAGRREIGPQIFAASFPQIRVHPAAVLASGLYLCSRSSRACGYVEKRPFRSSDREIPSTGHVENLGISEGVLWMKKSCPQRVHSWNQVLHRLSPN